MIDNLIPMTGYGCGFPRLYQMLKSLIELGYSVTFYPAGNPKMQPDPTELQQLGIEICHGGQANFNNFARTRVNYYDIVIISRPDVFKKMYDQVKQYFGRAALVYDAEALFYTREVLKAQVLGHEIKEAAKHKMIKDEIDLIKKADLVISVSDKEKDIMVEMTSSENILVWEYITEVHTSAIGFTQREDILFVGSFFAGRGSPNEDAAIYFAKQIFPKVYDKLHCRLFIVGTEPTKAVRNLASDNIIVTGFVDNLKEYYDKCRIYVVPTRFAAGIPIKLVEAMSYGIPAVVTKLIASQLELSDGKEVLVAGTIEEFIGKTIELYNDGRLWQAIRNNSLAYIGKHYISEMMKDKLEGVIKQGLKVTEKRIYHN